MELRINCVRISRARPVIQGRVTYENLQSLDQGSTSLKAKVTSTSQDVGTTQEKDEPIFLPGEEIKIPIEDEKLIQMQRKDKFCKNLLNQLESGKLASKNPYYIEDNILKRYVDDKKQRFKVTVLPRT